MESEENLTRKTQNLQQNLSEENSLPLANTSKKPIEKQTKSPSIFWNSVREWLVISDLPFMLVKALIFGLLIAIIACGWGLTTRGGPKEVGSSTTGAVVMTLITVSLVDVLLTQVLFG